MILRAALQNSMEAETATQQIKAAQAEAEAAAEEVARVEARAAEDRTMLLDRVHAAEAHASAVASQTLQLWDCCREAGLRVQASVEDALELAAQGSSEELEHAWRVAVKQKADLDTLLPQLHLSLSNPGVYARAMS